MPRKSRIWIERLSGGWAYVGHCRGIRQGVVTTTTTTTNASTRPSAYTSAYPCTNAYAYASAYTKVRGDNKEKQMR